MSEKFKSGEVVFHKLDGLPMLVDSVVRTDKGKKDRPLVKCEWRDGKGKFRDRIFKATSITHHKMVGSDESLSNVETVDGKPFTFAGMNETKQ